MPRPIFILADDRLINVASVRWIDLSGLERLRIVLHHEGGVIAVEGIQAIEAVMTLKASAFEGRRLRWERHVWAIHNLIGHPLMQALSFLGLHRTAFRIHDATVPRPSAGDHVMSR